MCGFTSALFTGSIGEPSRSTNSVRMRLMLVLLRPLPSVSLADAPFGGSWNGDTPQHPHSMPGGARRAPVLLNRPAHFLTFGAVRPAVGGRPGSIFRFRPAAGWT